MFTCLALFLSLTVLAAGIPNAVVPIGEVELCWDLTTRKQWRAGSPSQHMCDEEVSDMEPLLGEGYEGSVAQAYEGSVAEAHEGSVAEAYEGSTADGNW